jgi:hypothetical protein
VFVSECGGSRAQYCNIALLGNKNSSQPAGLWEQCRLLQNALEGPSSSCYLMVWCPHKSLLLYVFSHVPCKATFASNDPLCHCSKPFGCAARRQDIGSECCFYIRKAKQVANPFEVQRSSLIHPLLYPLFRSYSIAFRSGTPQY